MYLHSTMVLLKYLQKKNKHNWIRSTFHYGSIKIIDVSNMVGKCTVSTFHYGSIKINVLCLKR